MSPCTDDTSNNEFLTPSKQYSLIDRQLVYDKLKLLVDHSQVENNIKELERRIVLQEK
jgi:D-lyxose ketol-isomerase